MAFLLKYVPKAAKIGTWRRLSTSSPIIFSDEVKCAKSDGKPLVALESTIITHGMPYPQNLETAKQVEDVIRQRGAVPATIAILKGQLTVGLTADQLQYLAQAKGVVKASRRDLAPILAAKLDGATTVAGTIIASQLADIPVFVTGGIGGVHREGETTLDVSADLNELGRSNTLVVCSGVKSILDIGRTLEYLETQGVCVCAFGETHDFPAFYTPKSGHKAPHRVSDAAEAAATLLAATRLGLDSGIVVAVPVPKEHAMDENKIEEAISAALREAAASGVRGKEVTPFILAAVARATGGASLDANIALIKNNARVGADIAVEFKKLNVLNSHGTSNNGGKLSSRRFHTWSGDRAKLEETTALKNNRQVIEQTEEKPLVPGNMSGEVLVIGGANVDRTYRTTENVHLDGSTHPCKTEQCGGGVGRNMAEALWRLRGGRTRFLTAVGDDADGQYLADIAPGLMLDGCIVKKSRTATYAAVLDPRGECLLGLGDMALHSHISVEMVNRHRGVLEQAPLVVIDGNVPQTTMDHVLQLCSSMKKPECSVTKAYALRENEMNIPLLQWQLHAGENTLTENSTSSTIPAFSAASSSKIEGNHSPMITVATHCRHGLVPGNHNVAALVFFEPTDRRKATKVLKQKGGAIYSSPNLSELRAMAQYLSPHLAVQETKDFNEIIELSKIVSQYIDFIIVTVGAKGVVTVKHVENYLVINHYSIKPLSNVENVSGAGDCFASGFIHGMLLGLNESQNITIGFESAKQALVSKNTVPSDLNINTDETTEAEYVEYKIKNHKYKH